VGTTPKAAENVGRGFGIDRDAQDRMALCSQQRALGAQDAGFFDAEICPATLPQKKGEAVTVSRDEHPRPTSVEALAWCRPRARCWRAWGWHWRSWT
jgi:acetyl-CoA acetyltransferase